MESFQVDPRLSGDGIFLKDLKLCRVFLKHDMENPWLVLVPRHSDLVEIIDLSEEDQQQLMREIAFCSSVLQKEFHPDKLNVGALGNIVTQLHIHVLARFRSDRAWPNPIWGTTAQRSCSDVKTWENRILAQFNS